MEEDFPLVPPPVAPLDDALLRPVDIASTAIARALWPSFYEEAGNPVGSPAAVVAALALVAAMARADVAARIHAFLPSSMAIGRSTITAWPCCCEAGMETSQRRVSSCSSVPSSRAGRASTTT